MDDYINVKTTDFTTGQVGVMLANELNVGVVTDFVDIKLADSKVLAKHVTEMGYDMIESSMHCVVTVSKPLFDPRYATVKNKMAARKKAIDEITDITLKTDTMTVKNTYERPKRQSGVKIVGKPVEEAVVEAMGLIKDAKVL